MHENTSPTRVSVTVLLFSQCFGAVISRRRQIKKSVGRQKYHPVFSARSQKYLQLILAKFSHLFIVTILLSVYKFRPVTVTQLNYWTLLTRKTVLKKDLQKTTKEDKDVSLRQWRNAAQCIQNNRRQHYYYIVIIVACFSGLAFSFQRSSTEVRVYNLAIQLAKKRWRHSNFAAPLLRTVFGVAE